MAPLMLFGLSQISLGLEQRKRHPFKFRTVLDILCPPATSSMSRSQSEVAAVVSWHGKEPTKLERSSLRGTNMGHILIMELSFTPLTATLLLSENVPLVRSLVSMRL
jgi:hypothetical protein